MPLYPCVVYQLIFFLYLAVQHPSSVLKTKNPLLIFKFLLSLLFCLKWNTVAFISCLLSVFCIVGKTFFLPGFTNNNMQSLVCYVKLSSLIFESIFKDKKLHQVLTFRSRQIRIVIGNAIIMNFFFPSSNWNLSICFTVGDTF